MAIQFIGQATGTTSATLPAHQAGDIIIAFAFRDGSTTPATPPAGWTSIGFGAAGGSSCSYRTGYQVATASGTSSGTWTNATSVVFLVYRGQATSSPIGSNTAGSGSSATVTFPALTLAVTNGTSRVIAFAGHRTGSLTGLNGTTSNLTNRAYVGDSTDSAAGYDSNGGVSSWSSSTRSTGGSSSNFIATAIELEAAPEPTVDLDGDGFSVVDATGGLTNEIPLGGSGSVSATSEGTLETIGEPYDLVYEPVINEHPFNYYAFNASFPVTLGVVVELAGSGSTESTTSGALSKTVGLGGSLAALSTATSSTSVQFSVATQAVVDSFATGSVTLSKPLAVNAAAVSTTTAAPTVAYVIASAAQVNSSVVSSGLERVVSLHAGRSSAEFNGALFNAFEMNGGDSSFVGSTSGVASELVVALTVSGQLQVSSYAIGALQQTVPLAALAGTSAVTNLISADLGLTKPIASAVVVESTASGSPTVAFAIDGSAPVVATASASAAVTKGIAGQSLSESTGSGGITLTIPIAGSAELLASASGNVNLSIPLAGSVQALASTTSDTSVAFAASASLQCQSVASGSISIGKPLAASVEAVSSTTASPVVTYVIAADAQSVSDVSANLERIVVLQTGRSDAEFNSQLFNGFDFNGGNSSFVGVSSATSSYLGIETTVSGSLQVVSYAIGSIQQSIPLATLGGTASASNVVSAGMQLSIPLAGSGSAQSTASGDTAVAYRVDGSAVSVAAATASASLDKPLVASVSVDSVSQAAIAKTAVLAASAQVQTDATGSAVSNITLSGSALVDGSATGLPTVDYVVVGSGVSGSISTGNVALSKPFAGSGFGDATSQGQLGLTVNLGGSAVSTASATGTVTTQLAVAASVTCSSTASGYVYVDYKISATALTVVSGSGQLFVETNLSSLEGVSAVSNVVTADIKLTKPFSGNVISFANAVAALTSARAIDFNKIVGGTSAAASWNQIYATVDDPTIYAYAELVETLAEHQDLVIYADVSARQIYVEASIIEVLAEKIAA